MYEGMVYVWYMMVCFGMPLWMVWYGMLRRRNLNSTRAALPGHGGEFRVTFRLWPLLFTAVRCGAVVPRYAYVYVADEPRMSDATSPDFLTRRAPNIYRSRRRLLMVQ